MKARFFCEHCGKEVPLHTLTCPHCGQPFQAVQCPRCKFKGEPDLFTSGCPACGYLMQEPLKDQEETPPAPAWLFKILGLILIITIIFLLYLFFKL